MRQNDFLAVLVFGSLILGISAGCGGSSAPPTNEPAASPPKPSAAPTAAAPTLQKKFAPAPGDGDVKSAPSMSADAAVSSVIEGMRTNHPEALWDFLPPSMQGHLNEAVREIGRSADPELWNRFAELLKKAVSIFETKKDFILASPFWHAAEKIDVKQVSTHWPDIVGLMSSITNSDLSHVDRLKEFDGRRFLAEAGANFLMHLQAASATLKNNAIARLKDVKVTLKSESGDSAVVTIEVPGQPASDHEFTIIEGKWCPKAWVELIPQMSEWKSGVKAVLKSDEFVKRKESIMQELDQIETGIDQLLETKTAQEFNDLVAQRVIPYLLVRSAPFRSPGASDPSTPHHPDSDSGTATIIVPAKLDDKKSDELVTKLAAVSDNPAQSVVFGPNTTESGVEFTITPVGDVAAFAKRIDFGSVTKIDGDKRTVTVTVDEK